MEPLPIDNVLPQLIDYLSTAGAVVLQAEPGAGKTTRVPPAILDAGLSMLENNRAGQIIVLQPRRAAARAAAARMSEERGTVLGADIGYRVRHEGSSSRDTRILVCTEGVYLRRLQDDPSIETTAVVIFDEFHERSVNSDLALALTMQVRRELRPDLRLLVMSATLDTAPVSAFLDNCPVVESPGRTYPITVEYLQFSTDSTTDKLAAQGVSRMLPESRGNVLVFLPGVGEIRKTADILQPIAAAENLAVKPLYGEMSLADQMAVLRPGGQRMIVLSTNVAETSLTIDGVDTVIDTGFARVNRYDSSVGINRLTLSRISKASANQRAGRAGRTSAGRCLRLWSEREQLSMPDFDLPEIERLEMSECVLQLLAWGEKDVHAFPWFESPSEEAVNRALELLDRLDAIQEGKLTEIGRAMERFPLHPRLARLLIEGARLGQRERAALCAAVLSERSPFKKPEAYAKAHDRTDSDVLEQVRAIEAFQADGARDSIMGTLIPSAAKRVLRTSAQLIKLSKEASAVASKTVNPDADQALLRAIMTAFPDRICKRRQPKDMRGVMVGGRGIALSDESTVFDGELFCAVDLIDLNRTDLVVRRASSVERDWLPETHKTSSIEVSFDGVREKVVAFKRTRFCDLTLDESICSIPPHLDPGAILAEVVAADFNFSTLVDDQSGDYLRRIQCLREWLPELNLPEFGEGEQWRAFLSEWCSGCSSVAELRAKSLVPIIQSHLTGEQIVSLERDAPTHMTLPSGRKVNLQYEPGKPPVLAARIQEFFGMAETPRIARGRVSVILHLLAPNYRVQQITNDLRSFWRNTYPEVKKELKGRYPKHRWPDDPLVLEPQVSPKSRNKQ